MFVLIKPAFIFIAGHIVFVALVLFLAG